mgnify:FL=1
MQHERYSQASLVLAAFTVAQRLVAGGQFASWAAVVAQKKNQRLFFNFFMAQLGQYAPYTVVVVGKHRGKDPALYVLNVRELYHVLIRSLQWTVH